MATSSFSRNFAVTNKNADEFVEEMAKEIPPTLEPDFLSKLVHVNDDTELETIIKKALN